MTTKFSKFMRIVASMLVMFMLFNTIASSTAQASPISNVKTSEKPKLSANIGEIPDKNPKEKLELKSRRTAYSTTYLNPDGSYSTEVYSEAKYYQDSSDKQWKEIDNTLSKKSSSIENKSGNLKTNFAEKSGTGEIAAVEKNGKSISFIPVDSQAVTGKIQNNQITYAGIYKNTDVKYTLTGTKLKEDIILKSYTEKNIFSYELKLKDITASQDKSGLITMQDKKGNKLWYIEKPYMSDAEGKYSDKVTLALREEKGKLYVDVIADKEFLQDENTVFPVTIDPTVADYDVIRDTYISQLNPDASYSSLTSMYTGLTPSYGATRSLIQFTLPSLPSDSVITSANFQAYQTKTDGTNTSIDLYRVTNSWTGTATWNTQPAINGTKESTITNNVSGAYWQWDTTQLVTDWYNGFQSNNGMMLKQQNETTTSYRAFNSVNSGNYTPKLVINYWVDPIGNESYWGYTKDGVNPANGNLVLQQNDISLMGRGIPINVARTYNSRKATVAGMFGYGWSSDVEIHLVDAGLGPITLIDGDGTKHTFGEKIGGGYTSFNGVYLDLVKNPDGTYNITQTDGTIITFNTDGKMTSVKDTNNNTTTYGYTNGKLTSVTDASSRSINIQYGTNGYVSQITTPGSRTLSYQYDTNGNLTKITDPEQKEINLGYNATHQLTTVTDQRNISTTITYQSGSVHSISRPITIDGVQTTSTTNYTYDFNLSVTTVTDGEGRRIDYLYNPNKNIVQIEENPLDAQNKVITTYQYDNNNNLVEVKDGNTNKVGGSDAYVFTYDDNGNITGVQLPENESYNYSYDNANNLIEEVDANDNQSTNTYDEDSNQTESTDANMQTTASRYFINGNTDYDTSMISSVDNQVINSSFEKGITWPNNWTQSIEPGKTATISWSDTSKFGDKSVSITDPTGWVIISADRIEYEEGQDYVFSGYIKTENTTNKALIKIEFIDDQGLPMNGYTKFAYGLKGTHDWTRVNTTITSAPAGTQEIRISVGMNPGTGTAYFDGIQLEKGTVVSKYNLLENAGFERQRPDNIKPADWETSHFIDDVDGIYEKSGSQDEDVYNGNNSVKITGESSVNKYLKQIIQYDGDENTPFTLSGWSKQEGANPSGGKYTLQVQVNYNDGTNQTFGNDFSKTSEGWQHVAVDVKPTKAFSTIDVYYLYYNQSGTAWFDAIRLETGSIVTKYTYDAAGNYITKITDPLGNDMEYQYDAVGNNTAVTDGNDNTTAYEYDKRNLLNKVTDAKNNITLYGYDNAGNRTSVTDARNKVTSYEYNEFNQVSVITNPLNQSTQLGYDKNGNNTKITYEKGDVISYTYNALNRLDGIYVNGTQKWEYTYDANGNITSVANTQTGKVTTNTYDKDNRLTNVQEGANNSFAYSYDDNSNLTAIDITAGSTTVNQGFNYNSLNQLVNLTKNGSSFERFIYDEQGNVISIIRTNGTYTSNIYDDAGRLKAVKNYGPNGQLMDKYEYSYDANGNRTGVTTQTGTISYQYNELNQLTQETLPDGTVINYQYDSVGNRTQKSVVSGATTTYVYDDGNQLTSVNGQAYSYDDNGNMTSNGTKTFIYDEENRLIEVKNSSNQTIATYTYNDQGIRDSATTSTGTIYYHYSGDKVIYETDASNNIVAEYSYDAQGNPATMVKNSNTYYYHVNGHGDVVSMTDASGNIVAQYEYDAYGNILSQSGTMASANPLRYAGYRYDENTGLYYLMARYYDAGVGRFISRDSFHGVISEPQSLNQYNYCEGDPVNNVDPSGYARTKTYSGKQGWAVAALLTSIGAGIIYMTSHAIKLIGPYILGMIAGGPLGWVCAGITTLSLGVSAYVLLKFGKQFTSAGSQAVWYMARKGRFKLRFNDNFFSIFTVSY